MVIKGGARGGATQLSKHLKRTDTNERVEVLEIRGTVAEDLAGALYEIEAVGAGTRGTKPFYHASISTDPNEPMTKEQIAHSIDALELELGLEGQARAVVAHEKLGRGHVHIIWSRIDLEKMTCISDSFNYVAHERVARALEQEYGFKKVQGAHIDREGVERPERTPSHAEMQQAERSGLSPAEVKAHFAELWQRTDSGSAFVAAVEDEKWGLAAGDRRDFVLVSPTGQTYSLSRVLEGETAASVRIRMADVDRESLPSVAELKQEFREQREAVQGLKDAARADDKTLAAADNTAFWAGYRAKQDELTEARIAKGDQKRADEIARADPLPLPQLEAGLSGGLFVASNIIGGVAEALEDVCDALADLFAGTTAPREITDAEFSSSAAARAEYRAQRAAEREAAHARFLALDQLREDIEKGRHLDPESVKNLAPADHVNIKAKGGAHLLQIIEDHEREKARQNELGGRERER